MDPNTNRFEPLLSDQDEEAKDVLQLLNGEPVPGDWPVLRIGQELTVKGYRWTVDRCEGELLTLRAKGPLSKGQQLRNRAKRKRRKRK